MPVEVKPWDVTEILTSEEIIAAYLEEAQAEGDPAMLAKALEHVQRAREKNREASSAEEAGVKTGSSQLK
ncbi:MAG TPA: hypothetical protein PLQ11_01655 [Beijerinckiaceae bacterium]|nr:hypothetical protein [Beijerinckiaceae bacterium]